MKTITIKTSKRNEIINITDSVQEIVGKTEMKEGICLIYTPHATAGIAINENYDENVCSDVTDSLSKMFPKGIWKHDRIDGNGDSHLKATLIGPSVTIPILDSKLMLGRWQGIMLCEFDGPRERKVIIVCK